MEWLHFKPKEQTSDTAIISPKILFTIRFLCMHGYVLMEIRIQVSIQPIVAEAIRSLDTIIIPTKGYQ